MDSLYPFKHWILTLLIGPFIIAIFDFFSDGSSNMLDFFEAYPFFMIFGIMFSIPALILYVILFSIVPYKKISLPVLKWMFNLFIILCILLLNYFLGDLRISWYTFSYPIAVVISSLFLKMKANDEFPGNPQSSTL